MGPARSLHEEEVESTPLYMGSAEPQVGEAGPALRLVESGDEALWIRPDVYNSRAGGSDERRLTILVFWSPSRGLGMEMRLLLLEKSVATKTARANRTKPAAADAMLYCELSAAANESLLTPARRPMCSSCAPACGMSGLPLLRFVSRTVENSMVSSYTSLSMGALVSMGSSLASAGRALPPSARKAYAATAATIKCDARMVL